MFCPKLIQISDANKQFQDFLRDLGSNEVHLARSVGCSSISDVFWVNGLGYMEWSKLRWSGSIFFVWNILYAIVLLWDSAILWYFFTVRRYLTRLGLADLSVCGGHRDSPWRRCEMAHLYSRCLGWWYPICECSPWRLGKMKFLVEAYIFRWLNHPWNRLGCRFCQGSWLLQRFFSNALPRQKAKRSKATKADVWRVRVHIISFPNKFCHHVPLYQVLSRLMRAFCNSRYKHPDDRLSRNDPIFSLD